ncbi:MAG TPA: PocR ligand-binding domain-containing protein [Armatimonadota bacterium]|nr:PocR ligand-binding domain-containing protein [Armatimonadota bacterium]
MNVSSPITFQYLAESVAFARFSRIMHRLIGLPVMLLDPASAQVALHTSPEALSPLCRLIQTRPAGKASCLACDLAHARQLAAMRHPESYTCHAGLVDLMAPVSVGGTVIALITCGQLLPEPPGEAGFARIHDACRHLKLPDDAVRAAYNKAPYMDANAVAIALDMLAFFAEHLCAEEERVRAMMQAGTQSAIAAAIRYLHDHYAEEITLGMVARHVGWSPAYFSARFRAVTGSSFVDYLHQLRVRHAQTLLRETEQTVTYIALACGFNSQSQFHRVFRRLTGMSPGAYRHAAL